MGHRSFPNLVAVGAVALLMLTGCGGGSAPGQSATPTATASPAPDDGVPIDLDEADRLYYEGEFEQAIEIYSALGARGTDAQRPEALWSLARIQYQRGDNSGSEQSLSSLLREDVNPDQARLARLLLGTVRAAQGQIAEAEQEFNAYLESGGPAAPYAQLRLADLAARRDAPADAIAIVNKALVPTLPPSVRNEALFARAAYQEDTGDLAGALATYQQIVSTSERLTPKGEALWLAADLAERSADPEAARASLASIVIDYPWHARALEALSDPALTFGVSLAHRALVLYEQRLNDEAAEAFNGVIAEGGETADIRYYLAILAERGGRYDEALAQYGAAIALGGGILGQALWDRALLLEALGRTDEAVSDYAAIIDLAAASEHAKNGLFRAGFLRFRQGRAADAAAYWQRLLAALNDGETEAQAAFWLAKAAQAQGDTAAVATYLSAAVAADPLDYYGLRAQAMLAGAELPAAGEVEDVSPDWDAIEGWLGGWTTPTGTPTPRGTAREAGQETGRAVELLRAGLAEEAGVEFEYALANVSGDPWRLFDFLKATHQEGPASITARAAARLALKSADPPPALLALAYPAAYAGLSNAQAEENGFSPYLLLALVRQESFYDPDAVSSADATGLTQVIPSTAAGIAEQLGETEFRNSDLFRPSVSLRFGAYYLGAQLELFEGDVSAALAAYNGGPGNATEWDAAAGGDPDVFLETIEFTETRSYVELVLEHYAAYLYAHGVTDVPSLPLP